MSHIFEYEIAGRKLKAEYGKVGMLSNTAMLIIMEILLYY